MFFSRLFGRQSATPRVRPTVELSAAGADPSTPEMRVVCGHATDTGCVREINEDAIQVVRPDSPEELAKRGVLGVVCDGMGGHEAGEVASRLAIEAFVRHVRANSSDRRQVLAQAMETANRAVVDAAQREPRLKGMGTTCTAVWLHQGLAYCAHVGDSRCYMLRDDDLFLMTEDHSAVMELVRSGAITLEEARHHPDKNVISRALGSQREVSATCWPQPLVVRPGDRFVICSDGLYDMVSDEDIRAAVIADAPQPACDRLIALARANGGFDNISVAVLAMGEHTPQPPSHPKETRVVEIPS